MRTLPRLLLTLALLGTTVAGCAHSTTAQQREESGSPSASPSDYGAGQHPAGSWPTTQD